MVAPDGNGERRRQHGVHDARLTAAACGMRSTHRRPPNAPRRQAARFSTGFSTVLLNRELP
ncbi:hypothetical protein XHC_3333 [Xanthomonas hortorum pv. carotae str. M081]|nr:hypothetical protein XHC_3333 [Xanthomonas hortorum pv. carotae str. M081]